MGRADSLIHVKADGDKINIICHKEEQMQMVIRKMTNPDCIFEGYEEWDEKEDKKWILTFRILDEYESLDKTSSLEKIEKKQLSQETKNKDTKNILNSIISDINATDIDSLSPREALEKLYTYDKSIKKLDK